MIWKRYPEGSSSLVDSNDSRESLSPKRSVRRWNSWTTPLASSRRTDSNLIESMLPIPARCAISRLKQAEHNIRSPRASLTVSYCCTLADEHDGTPGNSNTQHPQPCISLAAARCSTKDRFRLRCAYFGTSDTGLGDCAAEQRRQPIKYSWGRPLAN